MFVRLWCLTLALAACGASKQEQAPDPRPRCTIAAAKTVDATLARRAVAAPMAKTPEGQRAIAELSPRMVDTLTGLCVEDGWPDTTTSCFSTGADPLACRDTLTPEQRGRYTTAMMQVMQVMTLAGAETKRAAK